VVILAALLLHGIAVMWVARSHQMAWPPEPEQIVPTLLLHPEPVRAPTPAQPKAAPKPVAAKPRPAPPSPAPAPTPAETPTTPPEDADVPVGAAAAAAADTGMVRDLSGDSNAPPASEPDARFAAPPSATLAVEIPLPLFFGSLSFRSTGAVDDYGLAPQQYEEKRGRRQPDVTTFHRTADPVPASGVPGGPTITFTRTPTVVPLPDGVQDRFSVFLQLTGLARGNPSRLTSPGVTLDLPIADTDSVEVARVQRVGEDMIDTPDGPIRAQHFVRLPRREGDARRVEIWLAAERGWLPVRLRQTEPGGMQFELDYLSQE
jgi:hypothetical protein